MAASYTRVQSSMKAQVRSKKASVKATNNTSIIEDLRAVLRPHRPANYALKSFRSNQEAVKALRRNIKNP